MRKDKRGDYEITEFLQRPAQAGDYVIVGNSASGWLGKVAAQFNDGSLAVTHLTDPRLGQMQLVVGSECWAVNAGKVGDRL